MVVDSCPDSGISHTSEVIAVSRELQWGQLCRGHIRGTGKQKGGGV